MNKDNVKYLKLIAMVVALPFIYGCGAGAGIGSLVGFLFGSGVAGGGISLLASGGSDIIAGGGAGLATLHQPEPATMLLLGGGLTAMGYFKSKKNRSSK